MNKFIIYLFLSLLTLGCVNKLNIKKANKPIANEIVSFDVVDIDEDGAISEKEFNRAKVNSSINYKDPMWSMYSIIGMVGGLLVLSSILQFKRKNKDVRN